MTVTEALREATQRLSATSDSARLDAELLMAFALGCSRSDMLLRHLRDAAPVGFQELIDRRGTHEPVAYITGEQEFFGLPFAVRPGVLIPRGDSETVVRAALEAAPGTRRVLDLGTGSGALLLAVLSQIPGAEGCGLDASPVAVETARGNAVALGLAERATIRRGNWKEAEWADGIGTFDLVLCNPPYVERDAALEPDVRAFEPAGALFAGIDGLDDYRILLPAIAALLEPDGAAVFEIGHEQGESVAQIAAEAGFAHELRRDLGGRPRALLLRRIP